MRPYVDENGVCYTIKRRLGSGGQGETYLTTDPAVIIKIQNPNGNSDPVQRYEEFRRQIDEVRALMLTPDMNIAEPVYLLRKPTCGYVMKFMRGMCSLNDLVMGFHNTPDDKKLEYYQNSGGLFRRLKLLREVARILYKLREKALVYVDLSYNNIFISNDTKEYRAWLIDADNIRRNGELGISIGTPECWAPEVASGCENTIYSDIYSFAVIAHVLLTGQKPFCGRIFINNMINYDEDQRSTPGAAVVDDWGDDRDEEPKADDWGDDEDDEPEAVDGVAAVGNGRPGDISELADRGFIPWIDDPDNRDNENPSLGLRRAVIKRTSELFDCFNQTFCREGRRDPFSRPDPRQWIKAIDVSLRQLIFCKCGWNYYSSEVACPVCDAKRPPFYTACVVERQYDDCRKLIGERNIAELVVSFDSRTELVRSLTQPVHFSGILDNDPATLTISNDKSGWTICGLESMEFHILDKSCGESRRCETGKRYVFKALEDVVICVVCNDRLRKISFRKG